jgi:hypothetical protein
MYIVILHAQEKITLATFGQLMPSSVAIALYVKCASYKYFLYHAQSKSNEMY